MSLEHIERLTRRSVPDAEDTSMVLADPKSHRKSQNMTVRNLRRFMIGNRLNLLGLIIVVIFLFLSAFGSIVAPYDPTAKGDIINEKLIGPSAHHLMGTDEQGRDVFSRVLGGARDSLMVAVVVLTVSVLVGVVVGAISGFFGGMIDEILMRITDMFLAFPALVLAISIAATLGPSLRNTMLALATVFWPWYARLVRAVRSSASANATTSMPRAASACRRRAS